MKQILELFHRSGRIGHVDDHCVLAKEIQLLLQVRVVGASGSNHCYASRP